MIVGDGVACVAVMKARGTWPGVVSLGERDCGYPFGNLACRLHSIRQRRGVRRVLLQYSLLVNFIHEMYFTSTESVSGDIDDVV
jgi:hypothetical protein